MAAQTRRVENCTGSFIEAGAFGERLRTCRTIDRLLPVAGANIHRIGVVRTRGGAWRPPPPDAAPLRAIGAVKHIAMDLATGMLALSCFMSKNCVLAAGSGQ
jgi:hypothetical protein